MSGVCPVWAAECTNCKQNIHTWLNGQYKEDVLKQRVAQHNQIDPQAKYRLVLVEPLKQEESPTQ